MKILFLGDSITEGAGASTPENTYFSIVLKMLNASGLNYGVSGTRIARQKELWANNVYFNYDFNMRLDIMPDDADLVICFGGTNDFGHGIAPLGEDDDSDVYTFKGATNTLFKNLIKKYGKEKVLVILPLPRYDEESDKGEFFVAKQPGSINLKTYVDIIRKFAEKYGLKYVDFRKEFGVPKSNTHEGLFFDGLHPSDEGHALLAKLIVKEIKNNGF